MSKSTAVEQIDFTIDQDWSQLIDAYQKIKEKVHQGVYSKNRKWVEEYHGQQFDFGDFGSWGSADSIAYTPNTAAMLNGPIVESFLPWTKQLKQDFEGTDLDSITLWEITGPIKPHVDGTIHHSNFKGHCRLNYCITDSDSVTYVDNDGETQSYPTKANTAWLVNTQKTHWVVNHQPRHLFMLTFNRPFAEMLAWFRSKPAFHYGK